MAVMRGINSNANAIPREQNKSTPEQQKRKGEGRTPVDRRNVLMPLHRRQRRHRWQKGIHSRTTAECHPKQKKRLNRHTREESFFLLSQV
jgi:hypothetical protein